MKFFCALLFVLTFSLAGLAQVENQKDPLNKPEVVPQNPAIKMSIPLLFNISRFLPQPTDSNSVKTKDLSFADPKAEVVSNEA